MKLIILCLSILAVTVRADNGSNWDLYIDNIVEQSKDGSGMPHVDKACIIGMDDGAKWTTDIHGNALRLSLEEGAKIARCFKSKDSTPFMTQAMMCEGTKYQFLREENQRWYAKGAGQGEIILQGSKTAIVVAHVPEGCQEVNAERAVAVIADYLNSMSM